MPSCDTCGALAICRSIERKNSCCEKNGKSRYCVDCGRRMPNALSAMTEVATEQYAWLRWVSKYCESGQYDCLDVAFSSRFWPAGCVKATRLGGTGNGPSADWAVAGVPACASACVVDWLAG